MTDGPETRSDHPTRAVGLRDRLDWMLVFPIAAAIAWAFGEDAVAMVLVAILPVCLLLDRRPSREPRGTDAAQGGGAVQRDAIRRIVDDVLEDCARRDRTTAVLQIRIDDLEVADGDWGDEAETRIMDLVVQRVRATMRGQDIVMRGADGAVVVVLAPTRRADLDTVMGIVDRLQAAIAEPVSIAGRALRVRSSLGICSEAMAPARTGTAMLAAADCALRLARRQGPDAVRAFTSDIRDRVETYHRLSTGIDAALETGQIVPWFQPQVEARTGRLVAFEALARWIHPELGVLPPERFLPASAAAGRAAELGEAILDASLAALPEWDRAGVGVPCVAVNLCLEQLSDPRLADRIAWQLDRHDIASDRVVFEIAETVTQREGDETITRNLRALREAGFRLDLDDFGTGAASIAHIARFGVHRIKIDRSFVQGIDVDQAQRRMVAAILVLAEKLGIETLAESVETESERAALAEIGCPHLQGFAIAPAMPLDATLTWRSPGPVRVLPTLAGMAPRGSA